MRSESIEETTEANRAAAASVARGRVLARDRESAAAAIDALLPSLVRLLSGSPAPALRTCLAQASERLARALGADRVGIYLPDPSAAAPTHPTNTSASESVATSAPGAERFVLAASSGSPVRPRADAAALADVDAIDLSAVEPVGRRLLEGRALRVLRPSSLRRSGAASGAIGASGWSRVHTTLLVPCPGPAGPAALIAFDGAFLAAPDAREIEARLEPVALLLAGFLERDRLARELAAVHAERAHAERLATLGRVACSVAHDLNNVLTVIVGHADLLGLDLEDGRGPVADTPSGQALEEIRLAAARGAGLVEEVLAYGRRPRGLAGPVDLAEVLEGLGGLLKRLAGDAIELRCAIEPALPPVRLERERFERIVVNLVANARHAIEAGGARPGRIELCLERAGEMPRSDARAGGDRVGDEAVRLRVRDDGCGMDAALQSRVFEPFFTTRHGEGGSGLGLADVADFARASGAIVDLESAPGAGCEIALRFPAASALAG